MLIESYYRSLCQRTNLVSAGIMDTTVEWYLSFLRACDSGKFVAEQDGDLITIKRFNDVGTLTHKDEIIADKAEITELLAGLASIGVGVTQKASEEVLVP